MGAQEDLFGDPSQQDSYGNGDGSHVATSNSDTSWGPNSPYEPSFIQGTSHTIDPSQSWIPGNSYKPIDPRNYWYGRNAGAADADVKLAQDTGASAYGTGQNLLGMNLAQAEAARARQTQYGDFAQQNGALQQAQGYGGNLAGLEQQQGPSGAQAQLQAGTNQGLATQIALARSGRGFGGGAGAMGQAQTNMAGIQANQANQAAMLSAQENAAWRGRQAANLGAAAGISQGVGSQFGQQANANLNAYYQNQGQNDQAALGYTGQGTDAYYKGVAGQMAGLGQASSVRGQEMQGGQAEEDRMLRAWAAQNGYNLGQQQREDQKQAGYLAAGANFVGSLL